jgi:hypothetical protein
MQRPVPIYIVASPNPKVGKTLTSRICRLRPLNSSIYPSAMSLPRCSTSQGT